MEMPNFHVRVRDETLDSSGIRKQNHQNRSSRSLVATTTVTLFPGHLIANGVYSAHVEAEGQSKLAKVGPKLRNAQIDSI